MTRTTDSGWERAERTRSVNEASATATAVTSGTRSTTCPRTRTSTLPTSAPAELDGPLTAGARVGMIEARVGDRVVARSPLVTATAVEEAGLATRLSHLLSRPATLLLVLLALACTVSLVLLRRRVVRRGGIRA